MRPKRTFLAIKKLHHCFETYFEPVQIERLTMNLNPYLDRGNHIPRLKQKADQLFGRPGAADSLDWVLPSGEFRRVMNFILENHPDSKLPADPVWLSFACDLTWKSSALPKVEWPEDLANSEDQSFKISSLSVNMQTGGRISFSMGIVIPISWQEDASYDFLSRFSADVPFKMSPKNFVVDKPVGKKGGWAWRKPDADTLARLQKAIP